MGKSTGKNVTAIQTPGAGVAGDTATNQTDTATNTADSATQDSGKLAAVGRGAGKLAAKVRPSRAEFLSMRAADVNPEELDSAVLTMDGWVCPTKAPASK